METCSTIVAIRERVNAWKSQGQRIALVPTMGNLHAGHLALVEQAQCRAERVVVSIFVNPMQFNESTDFDAYPRTLEQDARQLADMGVDALLAPSAAEVYPHGQEDTTRVLVPGLGDMLEGACRPGHFTGVATVVSKLFNMVQPHVAVFGEKDFQQLMLIRRMVAELDMPVEILSVPTLREPDGLAMSSRNSRLDPEQRQRAPVLYNTLRQLAERLQQGENDYAELEDRAMGCLRDGGYEPEYVAIRRTQDLQPPRPEDMTIVILAAARLGVTRLIDNIPVRLNLNH
jgi:pantoate--beta-alanine ligase